MRLFCAQGQSNRRGRYGHVTKVVLVGKCRMTIMSATVNLSKLKRNFLGFEGSVPGCYRLYLPRAVSKKRRLQKTPDHECNNVAYC